MKNKGFTALELLVVMAIMLILMGLMLVGLVKSRERARDDVRVAAVNEIMLGLEQFHAVCNAYPPKLDLAKEVTCPGIAGGSTTLGNFLPRLPKLPLETDEVFYATGTSAGSDRCTKYQIGIKLESENSKALGEDDNADAVDSGSNNPLCRGSDGGFSADGDLMLYDIASYE